MYLRTYLKPAADVNADVVCSYWICRSTQDTGETVRRRLEGSQGKSQTSLLATRAAAYYPQAKELASLELNGLDQRDVIIRIFLR